MAEHLKLRMICSDVQEPYEGTVYVVLHAVYSPDKGSPNYSYARATPSAELRMVITEPAALDHYVKGHEYDFDCIDHTVAASDPTDNGTAHQFAEPTQTEQDENA